MAKPVKSISPCSEAKTSPLLMVKPLQSGVSYRDSSYCSLYHILADWALGELVNRILASRRGWFREFVVIALRVFGLVLSLKNCLTLIDFRLRPSHALAPAPVDLERIPG